MATDKKSFILYCDLIHEVDHLTNEEKGLLFQHLLEYVNDKNPVLEDRVLLGSWKHIERQLKRDLAKYEAIKTKRVEAGRKGGKQTQANQASATFAKANQSVNGNVNVNVTVNDNVNDKEIRELAFREQVAQHTTYESSMLDTFADYWTESNEKGKKMKFEMQKTFDIVRRLKTWSNNGFDNKKPKNEPTNFDSVVWSASDIEKHMNDPFLSDEYKDGFIADLKAKNQLPTNYLKLGP